MKCTEAAVKAVLQELFKKLEVRKRAQIVRVAIEKRLIPIKAKSVQALRRNTADKPGLCVAARLEGPTTS